MSVAELLHDSNQSDTVLSQANDTGETSDKMLKTLQPEGTMRSVDTEFMQLSESSLNLDTVDYPSESSLAHSMEHKLGDCENVTSNPNPVSAVGVNSLPINNVQSKTGGCGETICGDLTNMCSNDATETAPMEANNGGDVGSSGGSGLTGPRKLTTGTSKTCLNSADNGRSNNNISNNDNSNNNNSNHKYLNYTNSERGRSQTSASQSSAGK